MSRNIVQSSGKRSGREILVYGQAGKPKPSTQQVQAAVARASEVRSEVLKESAKARQEYLAARKA